MSLLRATATIGFYTMISRVLGFVRDMLIAAALGANAESDAFMVATRLPNMFRTLFAEGAFQSAFVPIFTRRLTEAGPAAARRYAEAALALLLTFLLAAVVLAEIFTPALVTAIAPEFPHDSAQFAEAVALTRITFPYLLFISLASLQGGILTSLQRFAAYAVTPVLLNLFQIGAVMWSWRYGGAAIALSWCFTAAGLAQFLWLMGSCAKAGMSLRLPRPRLTPDMRRLGALMAPGVFGAGITQINLLVSTAVASGLPEGSISYLSYGDRLNQLPLAVIGTAVGTALLPALSRQLAEGDDARAALTQSRAMELALFLTIPAAAALSVIGEPILWVLFHHGHFDARAVAGTAGALAAYALGLPAFVLVKLLVPGFYARHDMALPVKIAVLALVVNLVLTLTLSIPFLHVGNAMATTTAGWVNALALFWLLRRKYGFSLDAGTRRRLPRILAAALAMAGVLAGLSRLLAPALHGGVLPVQVAALAALIALGLIAYAGFALLFGAGSIGDLKAMLRRRQAA